MLPYHLCKSVCLMHKPADDNFHHTVRCFGYFTFHWFYFTSAETVMYAFIAFIFSCRDYCHFPIDDVPKSQLSSLQHVQAAAVQLLTYTKKYCMYKSLPSTCTFTASQFIDVKILQKIVFLAFKTIHELAPNYITDLGLVLHFM